MTHDDLLYAWDTVAGVLPKPWPVAACLHDLRWHAWREMYGVRHPGRRTLAKRWGWTERKARTLLEGADADS